MNGFYDLPFFPTGSYAENGKDVVCAAVSSAAYMTANTITDVINDKADIKVNEKNGEMILTVVSPKEETLIVLKGFSIHIKQLSEQYPNCIKVISEV